MKLPVDFIAKYQELLGSEASDFLASFEKQAQSGFRINPLKEQQQSFEHPILGTNWGYYGKVSGKSVAHATGLVYSQEPAAQMVGQVAAPKPDMRVLDLSAAPGGKSTHLLSYLENTGLLVSNDISTKRSKILSENIERFGARNAIVTNESAERLASVFPSYFDMIVFDGPCSGEGMFRKDPSAVTYWHKDYPKECADLQKSILREAMPMLAQGGELVYSTCTWSKEENEEVVLWLLEQYPYLELVPIEKIAGMSEGIEMPEVARMYPHHFQGEGQFVAKLRDKRPKKTIQLRKARSNLTSLQLKEWKAFEQKHLKSSLSGIYQVFGDQLYLLPKDSPEMKNLKIMRNGLHLGTFKKNRFEPSFALGLALTPGEVINSLEITIEQFAVYVSGNIVPLETNQANGWYQITCEGNGLGFAKVTGNILKNYYPKGLRFQV
ncbi:RsmF rRNA methyltransferase first C-terminal domain-containing protein [Streptococcus sp. zg-JUN1979]|uniref:RsmF rRNA methyltransferase first C-terminal domain-containing protein n=1 Tax=Streptococcus sp. zg-JUN1979 TaxID=3391450 RepID=UPI0039A67376